MNNLEAIKSTVAGYPIPENSFVRILLDRSISAAADYIGVSEPFELATADVYKTLVTAANISEGDFQISVTDKSNFIKMANAIYAKYGLPIISDNIGKTIIVPRGKANIGW